MQQIELIVICLLIGVLLRWSGKLPDATPKALGGWVICVALPAMPPMLGASIIALDHDLEPDLVALMIGMGVPLSILTAWGWWSVLGAL